MKVIIAFATLVVALTATSAALATGPTSQTFTDDYGPFTQDCGTFDLEFSGTANVRETTYVDQAGHPTRIVAHVQIRETDRNLATGQSIEVRGSLTDTFDLITARRPSTARCTWRTTPARGASSTTQATLSSTRTEASSFTGHIRFSSLRARSSARRSPRSDGMGLEPWFEPPRLSVRSQPARCQGPNRDICDGRNMWETQRMLAQDREVELVRQAERVNRRMRRESTERGWRQVVAGAARLLLRRRAKQVPQQLPATTD